MENVMEEYGHLINYEDLPGVDHWTDIPFNPALGLKDNGVRQVMLSRLPDEGVIDLGFAVGEGF